jgi:3-hydroxyisobutyrate dehydrogenase-like beta-hydroxyacid dehydrogenase
MTTTIGFIGVGNMGGAMVRRLLGKGYEVLAYDADPAASERVRAAGARIAASPREVADQMEIVFACLPSTAISNAVAFGADGVSGGKAVKIYVETSTIGRAPMAAIAEKLATSGIALVDAPISGAVSGAEAGTLISILSGDQAAAARVEPIIAEYTARRLLAGPEAGMSQVYKLVNQGLIFSTVVVTVEAVAAGVKAGADPALLIEFLNGALGRNFVTAQTFPNTILPGKFGRGNLSIVLKDTDLFAEMCREVGAPTLISGVARAVWSMVAGRFGNKAELPAAALLYEEWTGIEMRSREQA